MNVLVGGSTAQLQRAVVGGGTGAVMAVSWKGPIVNWDWATLAAGQEPWPEAR